MPTLSELTEAVATTVQEPAVTDDDIHAILNRGVLELAGGGTRGYDVPTLPGLPELSTDFPIATIAGQNMVPMPAEYQRDGWYGFNSKYDQLRRFESLMEFKSRFSYDTGNTGAVYAFCLVGLTLHYVGSPSTPETLSIHGFRFPVDMVADSDEPDGIPKHLQYRLLHNYACMEIFSNTEQDMGGSGYNFQKHSALYEAALKDLNDVCLKDQPASDTPVDDSQFINNFV